MGVSTVYIFKIDGAKENDAFFKAECASASHVYAGIEFSIGAERWEPDLIKVVVEPPDRCSLTLIELEDTRSAAKIACRKYLPENSENILAGFSGYLERVVRHCRKHAHLGESEFAELKNVLSLARSVTVTTASALRSSTVFVEELALIDQPERAKLPDIVQDGNDETARAFEGDVPFCAIDGKALRRCVVILDAVIRDDDLSTGTFHAWRAPLKRLLAENHEDCSELWSLVFDSQHGIKLDFERLLSDLVQIWRPLLARDIDPERIRALANRYFPIAVLIKTYVDRMPSVFEVARKHVREANI